MPRTLNTYEVIVGNIGSVHSGHNQREALKHFGVYVAQSKNGSGRAAGENVTLFCNELEIRGYIGALAMHQHAQEEEEAHGS